MKLTLHIDRNPAESYIEIDGQPVEGVSGVHVSAEVDNPPTVTLTYACYEEISVEGEVQRIHHLCPWGRRT